MKNNKKDFINLLYDLCDIYKEYTKNNGGKLAVVIEPYVIKMSLLKNNNLIDEFGLTFNNREKDIYTYISVFVMRSLFGKKLIYGKDNRFLDSLENPMIEITINDIELASEVFNLVASYSVINSYNSSDKNKILRGKVNKVGDVKLLEERVKFTRCLIKNRGL